MKIQRLGHVVLRVADRDRSEKFYSGVLGIPMIARYDENGAKMAFFSLGNHHDLAVSQVSAEGGEASENEVGIDHVAFHIGEGIETLREAKTVLDRAGIVSTPIDHEVTLSLYFKDPDGNGVELYVDASDAWRREPGRVAQARPLTL